MYHNDIHSLATLQGVDTDELDVKLFLTRYDADADGKLSFLELWDAFAPLRKEYAILLAEREPISLEKIRKRGIDGFRKETKFEIIQFLNLQLIAEREIEKMRVDLDLSPSLNPLELFRSFGNPDLSRDEMWSSTKSVSSIGKLSKKDFRYAFQQAGYCLSTQEVSLIFNRFVT